jgi:MFS family permease
MSDMQQGGESMGVSYPVTAKAESSMVWVAKRIIALSGLALVITFFFAMVPALPEMAHYFRQSGNGPFVAQMVMALPVFAMLLGAPLGGWIADTIGIRRCLLASLVTYVAAGAVCIVAPNLPSLIVARLLLGLGGAAAATMSTALTAEWYEGAERNRILGYAHAVVLVYNILMLASGGWLVDHVGWRAPSVFYLVGVVTLAATWLATRGRGETVFVWRPHASGGASPSRVWPLYLLAFLLAFGASMPTMQGPFLLAGAGVSSSASRSLILEAMIITGALASASYAPLRGHLRHSTLIVASSLSMGLGTILTGIHASNLDVIAAGYIVSGIGYGLYIPVISAIVLNATSAAMRNRAVGIMNAAIMLATVANPLAISLLKRVFAFPQAVVVVGVALFLVGPAFVLVFRPDRTAAQ